MGLHARPENMRYVAHGRERRTAGQRAGGLRAVSLTGAGWSGRRGFSRVRGVWRARDEWL